MRSRKPGVGLVLADLVELLSMGNLLLMLVLTAIFSLVLGMGLPTTANYIVVSSLLVPVIVTLGQQNGLIVPLIAVHLFVFYFGIMADVTPPVGLASAAAAAVSKGDPIKTGDAAFYYSLRTAILPFLFIFNTDLLLIDVDFWHGVLIFIIATVAMLIFRRRQPGLLPGAQPLVAETPSCQPVARPSSAQVSDGISRTTLHHISAGCTN